MESESRAAERALEHNPGLPPHTAARDSRPFWLTLAVVCTALAFVSSTVFARRLSPLQRLAAAKLELYGFGPAAIQSWALDKSQGDLLDDLDFVLDALDPASSLGTPPPESEVLPSPPVKDSGSAFA